MDAPNSNDLEDMNSNVDKQVSDGSPNIYIAHIDAKETGSIDATKLKPQEL